MKNGSSPLQAENQTNYWKGLSFHYVDKGHKTEIDGRI